MTKHNRIATKPCLAYRLFRAFEQSWLAVGIFYAVILAGIVLINVWSQT